MQQPHREVPNSSLHPPACVLHPASILPPQVSSSVYGTRLKAARYVGRQFPPILTWLVALDWQNSCIRSASPLCHQQTSCQDEFKAPPCLKRPIGGLFLPSSSHPPPFLSGTPFAATLMFAAVIISKLTWDLPSSHESDPTLGFVRSDLVPGFYSVTFSVLLLLIISSFLMKISTLDTLLKPPLV